MCLITPLGKVSISIDGKEVTIKNPADAIKHSKK